MLCSVYLKDVRSGFWKRFCQSLRGCYNVTWHPQESATTMTRQNSPARHVVVSL